MIPEAIRLIITEELSTAQDRINERLSHLSFIDDSADLPPLPENEKYAQALELYQNGASHSEVVRQLKTPMNNVKRYYSWLVNKGYLPIKEQELSEREKQVTTCIYEEGLSLNATAQKLKISVPNVVQRRDNALRKGYKPPEKEATE